MTSRSEQGSLVGSWQRDDDQPDCAAKYPMELDFGPGTYRGRRGAGQGFLWWDAGSYRLEPGRLLLTVATDELVTYQVEVTGGRLDVVDPDGCRFAYRRVAEAPATAAQPSQLRGKHHGTQAESAGGTG